MIEKIYTTSAYNALDDLPFLLGPFYTETLRIATSNIDWYLAFSADLDNNPNAQDYDLIIPRNTVEYFPNILGGFVSVKAIDYTGDSSLLQGRISISEVDLRYDNKR